jgi:hypothetical protein
MKDFGSDDANVFWCVNNDAQRLASDVFDADQHPLAGWQDERQRFVGFAGEN